MDGTVERYLSLLRQGLWGAGGRPSAGPVVPMGEEEFAVAHQQSTTGLVVRFSEEERYQNELLFLRFTWHLHVAVLGEVKAKLDGAGIPFVLLKGLGCDFYYPEYGLRNLGDIDIYVGEENYGRAAEVFGCDAAASRSPKHFSVTVQDVTVEVHRTCEILPSRRADKHFRELAAAGLGSDLHTLNIGGVEVRTPQDDFNAIYLFVHFFDHFLGGGCGLRQVCDWALFLHARRDSLDRDYLASALEALGLTNAWRTFGALAVRHLGLPAVSLPCSGLPAAGLSAAGVPDAGLPAAGVPDAGLSAAGLSAAGLPAAGLPAAGLPAAGLSAAGVPDAGLPAAGLSAAGVPDAGQLPLLPPRLARRADRLLRVMLEMGNFGKIRKQERRRRFGTGFLSRKLGSLLGALHHSFELLALFPVHSLRGISQTLVNSTAKSLRQLFSRG